MEGVRNYRIQFMKGTSYNITAESALTLMKKLEDGAKMIIVGGEAKAAHQIIEIVRDKAVEFDDIYDNYGVALQTNHVHYDREKAMKFLSANENLLTTGSLNEERKQRKLN